MNDKRYLGQLTFGFDIGIASVGWAVLNESRILDLGVRCFDKAETAKEGESLNLARRNARLLRRRLRRRAWRLTKLARLLKREGIINNVNVLKQPPEKGFATPNLWQLRVDGLDRKLNSEEWARVVYHLCKHRGFHWVSKAEKLKDEEGASETGKVKKGLAATTKLMKEKGYRSAAEMVLAEFPDAQRNKQGEYSKALERELLSSEFTTLFEAQRSFGNPHTSADLEEKLLNRKIGLFWAQKPSLSGEALLKMLGKCTFEKSEFRAPKASFTAERHVWLTRLNNLRLVVDGNQRPLTEDERRLVIDLPYNQAGDLKFKQFKSILVKQAGLSEYIRFTGLSYPSASQLESGKAKDPEDSILVKMPAFQELRKTLKEGLETEWQGMVNAAMSGDASLLDQIAWVLSIYKEDDEVERELNKLNLPNKQKMVEALLGVRFDKFSNLSLKALYKIVPVMEQGKRYDEACVEAGYNHSQLVKTDDTKQHYLPPFYSARDNTGKLIFNENLDIPRNPVVLRALNQARKVCNALIKKYGSPYQVNIEMARDLSKPFDERRKIQTEQEAFREKNQKAKDFFKAEFNTTGELKGRDFEKWQLYSEQECKCAYSGLPLDIHRLFDLGYAEIDHALPYSRSFDDSKNNRVLVLANENRNKGNQTPFEYLDGKNNSARWHAFVVWVNSNKAYRQAKRNRLLKKDFGEKDAQEFRDRNLNDTRYICRFFKNYVEQNLQLHVESEAKRCVVLSGQMTAFLRNRWGLTKVRADSDRHHALDAVVVASASHGMVKRLSDYARRKELQKVSQGFVDVTTGEVPDIAMFNQLNEHFPQPWENFRHELEARLKQDDIAQLRTHCEKLGNYSEEDLAQIKPLFVSRAPQRRNSGAAHKETIYGKPKGHQVLLVSDKEAQKLIGEKSDRVTRPATPKEKSELAIQTLGVIDKDTSGNYKFTLDKLDTLVDLHRNQRMVNALRIWLQDRDVRDKKAKEIENSLGKGKNKRDLREEEREELLYLRALPRKPTKTDPENGPFTGPIIRSVKVNIGKTSGIPIRHGIAENASGSMLRIDVFKKESKFHLIPVYVHHQVAKELPQYAIVANKNEDEWTLIDESYVFCFTAYPNDLIKVTQRSGEIIFGYYRSCHSGTAALSIALHDRYAYGEKTTSLSLSKKDHSKTLPNDKLGLIEGIGVKMAANFEKFNVDVLGNIYPALKETRGLA